MFLASRVAGHEEMVWNNNNTKTNKQASKQEERTYSKTVNKPEKGDKKVIMTRGKYQNKGVLLLLGGASIHYVLWLLQSAVVN